MALTEIGLADDLSLEDSTLILAGHSQGGMVAGIVGAYFSELSIAKSWNTDLRVITFGNPGSGDEEFTLYYGGKILSRNYVNTEDPVPYGHSVVNSTWQDFKPYLTVGFRLAAIALEEDGMIPESAPHALRYGTDIEFNLNHFSAPRWISGDGLGADHDMVHTYLIELSLRKEDQK